MDDLQVAWRPLGELIPYARNPRTHSDAQVAQIAGSIRDFGWTNPILVDGANGIIAGHGRVLAARKLGLDQVPVIELARMTEAQRRAYALADNQLALNAGWDEALLRLELTDLEALGVDLGLLGFGVGELERLLAGAGRTGRTEDDDAPSLPERAVTRPGDLWVLGEHRLLCGDATVPADVERVLEGRLADMTFTDPPYNVDYGSSAKDKLRGKSRPILNDALGDGFAAFLYDACTNILQVTKGAVYICMSSSELDTLQRAFTAAGGRWSTFIIWAKHAFTLGRADYQRQYEPILYGWKEGGDHYWCGARDQGDVWFVDKPAKNDLHPTMKPVALVERAVRNSSKSRDLVLDPFGGAGSTLIACAKAGRHARLVELDPKYCDVIVRRWRARNATIAAGCGGGLAMPVSVTRLGPGVLVLLALALSAAPAPAPAAPPGVTWAERLEVAAGGGYQGPWRMNESVFEYVDDPTVAINDRGVVGVAWADQSEQDIFVQIYEPDGTERFEAPVNVSGSPGVFSWLPRLLIGAGEGREVSLLWQEIVFSGGSHGGEIFFARSTDGGASFSAPRNLSNTIAGAGKGRLTPRHWHNGSLDLAPGPEGHLYAAWTEYEGGLWFSRSTDHGASFAAPVRLAGGGDAMPARGPALAVDAAGVVYLAWTVGDDPAANIHIARSVDQGRSFGAPQIVASAGHADAPKLAVHGRGTVHLVYAESPAGPFDRYHIRYTRSDDGGRTFADPREISGPHAERFASVGFPALSVDGADNLYVLWELFPRRGERPQGLGFAWSSDGGRTFAAPEIVPGSVDPALGANGGRQGLLMRKLAVNGAGMVAVVNSTFKTNERSHVWLFRGQRTGG